MATALRPIGHDERLTVVGHLDELRSRLILCAITLGVAFGLCFWQNQPLLHLLNRPLERSTPSLSSHSGKGRLARLSSAQAALYRSAVAERAAYQRLARAPGQSPAARAAFSALARAKAQEAAALPRTVPKREPVTLGVGEPFMTTTAVAAAFALLFSLPMILYQAYAFVLPALRPSERGVATPVMLMAPVLFSAGVLFGYFLVLPPAISFLQNFNDQSFDVLIQARPYYSFEIVTLLAVGMIFQLPLGMLALQRLGVISAEFLRRNWRYAVVIIAIVAAALPGVDPVTTMLEMLPLLVLYGLSILLVAMADRRAARRGPPAPEGPDDTEDGFEEPI